MTRALGGSSASLQHVVKVALGATLLFAAGGIVLRALLAVRSRARGTSPAVVRVRTVPTVLIGVAGGLIVGMTSVGSGSLMIVALMFLYPGLSTAELVGTDLVQAIPLVGAAALGHLLFGDFRMDVTNSVLLGAIPGVYLGARVSAGASHGLIRRALVVVLTLSGLKLLDVSDQGLVTALLLLPTVGLAAWVAVRHTEGFSRRPARLDAKGALRLAVAAGTGTGAGRRGGRYPLAAPTPD